jgi:RecB family endonuclease NucS
MSFSIDLAQFDAAPMPEVSLAEAGIRERADLQRWIERYPELIERDLLLVTTEFDQWQLRDRRVPDRLDVLFLDSAGSLLVAELKRDIAPDTTELQALKYAAYCSQLTVPDVVEQYARHHAVAPEEARAAIVEHAPALEAQELGPIRVRLVANGFGPSVTHVVLFLIDHGLDIGCVEVTARRHGESHIILTSRQILPPPAAEDYLVKRRRREQEEEVREATTRRRNSVTVLSEADAIPVGTELRLNLDAFTPEQRARIEQRAATTPDYQTAAWTGLGIREALRWSHDGQHYSCSGLIEKMLVELSFSPISIPGPDYWLAPSGRTLYYEAVALEEGTRSGNSTGGTAA